MGKSHKFGHRHDETTLLGCLQGEVTYEFHDIEPVTLSSASRFNAVFKRQTGLTPSQWRQRES